MLLLSAISTLHANGLTTLEREKVPAAPGLCAAAHTAPTRHPHTAHSATLPAGKSSHSQPAPVLPLLLHPRISLKVLQVQNLDAAT